MFAKAGKTFVDVNVVDWTEVPQKIRVRIKDLIRYFAREARSLSGCRTLAGISGDWRPIDNLAQEILNYSKDVNVEALRRESRKVGLIPKF
jgi:hypothetical protein